MLRNAYRALVSAILVVLLTGCDQIKVLDDLKGQVSDSNKRISDLVVEAANSQRKVLDVQAQIAELQGRLAAIEAPKNTTRSEGSGALSNEQISWLRQAIEKCVMSVRALETTVSSDASGNNVYSKFDAFYNPASNRVLNNNRYVDQSPVYAFNKCMTSEGSPLK